MLKGKFVAVFVILWNCMIIYGYYYVFMPQYEQIFTECDNNSRTIHTFMDLSNLTTTYEDDHVHVEGTAQLIWDVDPSNRVEGRAELFRWKRNTWEPTIFTLERHDFCKSFDKQFEIWYDCFVQYIPPDERVCFNHRGAYYHFKPFDFSLRTKLAYIFEINSYFKIKIDFAAWNDADKTLVSTFCYEIRGFIKKIR